MKPIPDHARVPLVGGAHQCSLAAVVGRVDFHLSTVQDELHDPPVTLSGGKHQRVPAPATDRADVNALVVYRIVFPSIQYNMCYTRKVESSYRSRVQSLLGNCYLYLYFYTLLASSCCTTFS